jgi:hypothetical protein
MKMKKRNIIGLLVVLAVFFTGCAQTEFDAIPSSKLMGDSLATTYTIQQLLLDYKTDSDAYTDTTKFVGGLFTAKLIKSAQDVVINGVVTSSDVEGNVYKYIVVQEMGINGRAIKLSIDASGLSGIYPLGQHVSIRLNDLYLGKYAQSYQIGIRYTNPEKFKYKKSIDSTIYRVEPGRIPLPIIQQAIHAHGLPNVKDIKVDTLTIAQIRAKGDTVLNKLVCIKNAYFTGKGADYGLPANIIKDEDLIFAPSTNGVGYPQSREIQDGSGSSMFISTSEYAKFATYKLPASSYRGNITAIVGWYNDKKPSDSPALVTNTIYHQLTIRSITDLGKGFENYRVQYNK